MISDPVDLAALKESVRFLEHPGFLMRVANWVGKPLESAARMLPEKARGVVEKATAYSLQKALQAACMTLDGRRTDHEPSLVWHKVLVGVSGFMGGAGGATTFAAELPMSTVILFRSILDVARSKGEDIGDPECQMAAMQVFALGGNAQADDAAESSYYALRVALWNTVREATEYIARVGAVKAAKDMLGGRSAPVLIRLLDRIGSRFGVAVSEKFVAQSAPLVGALGGAGINLVFMNHFQDMALGQFTVRRLERKYGHDAVRETYLAIMRAQE